MAHPSSRAESGVKGWKRRIRSSVENPGPSSATTDCGAAICSRRADPDGASRPRVLDGVDDEVLDRTLQETSIRLDDDGIREYVEKHHAAPLGERGIHAIDSCDDFEA